MSIEPTLYWAIVGGLGAILLGIVAFLIWLSRRMMRLDRQHKVLMTGVDGGNIEELLAQHLVSIEGAKTTLGEQRGQINGLTDRTQTALRHIGLVRYNPFADGGGDFSFALALTDDRGDGVVLCSLYARTGARIYCKPLTAWETTYALTDEEREAIAEAQPPWILRHTRLTRGRHSE